MRRAAVHKQVAGRKAVGPEAARPGTGWSAAPRDHRLGSAGRADWPRARSAPSAVAQTHRPRYRQMCDRAEPRSSGCSTCITRIEPCATFRPVPAGKRAGTPPVPRPSPPARRRRTRPHRSSRSRPVRPSQERAHLGDTGRRDLEQDDVMHQAHLIGMDGHAWTYRSLVARPQRQSSDSRPRLCLWQVRGLRPEAQIGAREIDRLGRGMSVRAGRPGSPASSPSSQRSKSSRSCGRSLCASSAAADRHQRPATAAWYRPAPPDASVRHSAPRSRNR